MIKLITITIKYIKGVYTTNKHNLINGISLLQEWWRWYLCLNVHQVTFDCSILEAYISRTKNDRNKWILDSKSWHREGYTSLRKGSNGTNNIHVQRDAQKNCFNLPLYYITICKYVQINVARQLWISVKFQYFHLFIFSMIGMYVLLILTTIQLINNTINEWLYLIIAGVVSECLHQDVINCWSWLCGSNYSVCVYP